MTALQTLNATVAQIEDALTAGQTVQQVAREFSEPAANVYAVQRAMQARDPKPVSQPVTKTPGVPAPGARPLTSVPTPESAPSVDALVNAAARSSSKRTQALGVKLHDLVEVIRARLTEEKAKAEQDEKNRRERELAAAEVSRLEAELAEARRKAGLRGPGLTPGNRTPRTPAQIESARKNIAKGRAAKSAKSGSKS